MDENAAQKLIAIIDPHINKESGNMIMVVGSSECGKSTLTCSVLMPILSKSNGFITSFMSPNYDSIPLQRLILKSKKEDTKDVVWEPDEEKKTYKSKKQKKVIKGGDVQAKFDPKAEKGVATNTGNVNGIAGLPNFKISDIYKTTEWIFLKRGWDVNYAWKIYHLRLLLNKRYNESGEVRNFRFAMVLDDEIDLKTGLLRQICLTWRNRNITFVQNVQDITNLDTACRNSVQLFFFGYSNFPARREKIVKEYLAPFMSGANVQEKMDTFYRLTQNKCFVFVDNRKRQAYHIDTQTGSVQEIRELTDSADHALNIAKQPVGLEAPTMQNKPVITKTVHTQENGNVLEPLKKKRKKMVHSSLTSMPLKL